VKVNILMLLVGIVMTRDSFSLLLWAWVITIWNFYWSWFLVNPLLCLETVHTFWDMCRHHWIWLQRGVACMVVVPLIGFCWTLVFYEFTRHKKC